MKVNKVVTISLGITLSSLVFAGENDNLWRPVGTLSLSPAWCSPGETQTVYVQPNLPETFTANSTTEDFVNSELFLSLQHRLTPPLLAQLGLAVATTTTIPLNGDIWQDADPDFNNLFYDYKIRHTHLAAKGKLLADVYQLVQPYISGSLGVGFNYAYHYKSTSKRFEVLPEPPFTSHTTTALTYTLGAGLQRALNTHWSVGVGYEFTDWGKTSLGAAPAQLSNASLNLNHIYTNQLQLSISFVA